MAEQKRDVVTDSKQPQMSRSERLRSLLQASPLAFLLEAHDGVSAKIVEEAGFEGIWASGLTLSASMGVRDSNEASWTQVLEQLEFMSDACSIPILLDGDTGYGNFNNARRLVRKLQQRGIAGVCLEDKIFPKTNSFIGDHHPLADIDEFCGKLQAARDSVGAAFVLVARVEALIAGWGMAEALRRAERYHQAGADAILIHSRRSDAQEVLTFAQEWARRCPLVIVPTKYITTPLALYQEHGINMVIWANHLLRASVRAMQEACAHIRHDGTPAALEESIAPVEELFRLTGNEELLQAEKRYLRRRREKPLRAVILAAARGHHLERLTKKLPKAMLDVRGRPLLKRLVGVFAQSGVRDIGIVRGYGRQHVDMESVRFFDNDDYATSGEAWSLYCARSMFQQAEGNSIICYGDILFRRALLDDLLDCRGDIVLAVNPLSDEQRALGYRRRDKNRDGISASQPYRGDYMQQWDDVFLTDIDIMTKNKAVDGEWIGIVRCSEKGQATILAELEAMQAESVLQDKKADMPYLFRRLIQKNVRLRVFYTPLPWLDVDDIYDLAEARNRD